VKRGQLLAQLENVQSTADVAATKASLEASRTDAVAAVANLIRPGGFESRESGRREKPAGLAAGRRVFKDALISRRLRVAEDDLADVGSRTGAGRSASGPGRAQVDSADRHVTQTDATLTRAADVLQKTVYAAPYAGVIRTFRYGKARQWSSGFRMRRAAH